MSQDVLNSIQSAWANSTKKNLKHQKSVYIRFCDRMGFKELPVSVYKLSLFVQELANQNFKVTTIKNYVSSVKSFQVLSGYSASVFDSELIRLLFKGLSRIQLRGPNQVAPITPKILLQIHACLDLTQQSDITFWSFLVLSFLLMARKSNLVPDSVAGFDAKKQLTWQDVKFGNGVLLISLKWSKTNQFFEKVHAVPLVAIPGSPLCPVETISILHRLTPHRPNDPLFLRFRLGKWEPVTYKQVLGKLKQVLNCIGRVSDAYGTHSLRRGGATFAASIGVPRHVIQAVGDWRSDAVDEYIKVPLASRVQAAELMRDGLSWSGRGSDPH